MHEKCQNEKKGPAPHHRFADLNLKKGENYNYLRKIGNK